MKKILVTSIGSYSADIIIKNLHLNGYYVIGTDINPKEWVVDAQNVDEFYRVPLANEQEKYICCLLEICKKSKVDFIFPLTDAEIDILNLYRNNFAELSVDLCMSGFDTICVCRNKRKTETVLGQAGVCMVVSSYSCEEIENGKISFPVVCKPFNGRSSQGLSIFKDKNSFLAYYNGNNLCEYLIQPYIPGSIVTVDVVRDKISNDCVAIARRELLRTLNGAGLCVQVFRDTELEKLCMNVAEILDIVGCANFEFIEGTDERRYFLECNPRFSGGVEFSVISGYDCVMNHLRCFKGERIEIRPNIREYCISRKYEEYVTSSVN